MHMRITIIPYFENTKYRILSIISGIAENYEVINLNKYISVDLPVHWLQPLFQQFHQL